MDALKALKEKLKQEKNTSIPAQEGKKYVTKAELEAARLLKIRQEEEEERKRKELKRKQTEAQEDEPTAKASKKDNSDDDVRLPDLPREEVIRRLRALSHPATLFGEDDVDRLRRLLKAEKEVQIEEETRGGQQENSILELQRQERQKARQRALELAALKEAAELEKEEKRQEAMLTKAKIAGADGNSSDKDKKESTPEAAAAPAPEDATMEAFKAAAAKLAGKRAEESLPVEQRIKKWIKKWMAEWEADLDKRPDAVKATAVGYQASLLYQQSKKYFEPLYHRLDAKVLHEELRAGLWMMIKAMQDRNYLYANDIYLRLAIGNAPWPMGVTQVGIHERSAREKISHVMNQSGQAHIMNDEATRKFLQAMKRLIGAVQRMYPTVPSRSVDFETAVDPGRGVSGAGSTKLALLQAESQGETVEALGLPAAPHFLEEDGKVMVPLKWKNILEKTKQAMPELADGSTGGPDRRSQTPPPPAAAKT